MFISAPQSLPHMSAETSLTGPTWRAQGGQRYARVRLHRTGQSRSGGFSPPDPLPRCRARPHRMAAVGADRHTGVWPPTATYHLAHALYEPAALPPPPELRDHPDRCPPLGTGLVGGRAMRASCSSDRGPDRRRRRVTPRSSFPVSLAVSRVRAGRRRSCRRSAAARLPCTTVRDG